MSEEEGESQTVEVPGIQSAAAFGTPKVVTSAAWPWLVEGFRRARARLDAATTERDPVETFLPLFETLNWAVAISDYAEERGPKIDGDVLRGLRFVRNAVHHQWADALEPREVPFPQVVRAAGHGPRIVAPPTVVEWYWKPAAKLPNPPPRHARSQATLQPAYVAELEGQPARLALDHLDALLRSRET